MQPDFVQPGEAHAGADFPPDTEGSEDTSAWTPEACLAAYQATNDRYWNEHGLSMRHSALPSAGMAVQAAAMGALTNSTIQTQSHGPRYEVLPQKAYVARRRFEPKPPITFLTGSTPYITLADALSGNVAHLHGQDEAVFSEDHLSQKQSLRLEIMGCRSYERQINVRSPANSFRSVTKGKLAEKIAREIFDYMARHQSGPFGLPRFTLGPGTAGYERLVLLELRHVSKSSWQPVLGVLC